MNVVVLADLTFNYRESFFITNGFQKFNKPAAYLSG